MIGTNFGIFRPSQSGSGNNNSGPHQSSLIGNSGSIHVSDDRPQGTQLSDFILQLEDYVPTVPDAVTAHYLNSAGFESNDPRIVRLISVATQKFISDVANDALQHCKTRTNSQGGGASSGSQSGTSSTGPGGPKGQKPAKDRKYTLTMDDLTPAIADYGITVRKAKYFV